MTGWTVMLRGIGFRAGRSLLVLLIAAVAVSAAVATAGYLRAAQQSVLTDGLRNAPEYQTALVVGGTGSPASGFPGIDQAHLAISQSLGQNPLLTTAFGKPIAAEDTDTLMTVASGGTGTSGTSGGLAWVAYRDDVCSHLVIAGKCPSAPGEVVVSKRSAAAAGIKVGTSLQTEFGDSPALTGPTKQSASRYLTERVVGIYTPRDINSPYWGGNAYFAGGLDTGSPTQLRLDAAFTSSEQDIRHYAADDVSLHVELPLNPGTVTADNLPTLLSDIKSLTASAATQSLFVDTGITLSLHDVAAAQHSLATTIPVVAVPLLILCLFVLFLVVAALTDERAPEIALAKLRGYSSGRAARFGIAEMLALILLATPLGIAVGFGLAELAARTILASGTHAEVRTPIFTAGIVAMIAGVVAAWLATRSTLRRGVLSLLRRVPQRTSWRAGVGIGIVVAFVAASLVAAFLNRRSPIAWLAAPSIALIAGLVAARLLALASSWRLRTAAKRGRLAGMISGAWLARQPGRNRVVVVLTVAVALLVFGAVGWDTGSTARSNSAVDTLGAQRVYAVAAAYPTALANALHAADPSGNSMAVIRARQYYKNGYVELVGLEASRLAKVGIWRGESASQIAKIGAALSPKAAPKLTVSGTMTVSADATSVKPGTAELNAVVAPPGQPPVQETLGELVNGPQTYSAALFSCGGCRFLGLSLSRDPGVSGRASASVRINSISATGISVHDFSNPMLWGTQAVAANSDDDSKLAVTLGKALSVDWSTDGVEAGVIAYRDSPSTLPVVVAGGSKSSDPTATEFTFPGLGEFPDQMTVVGRADRIPRAGTDALLFDLGTGVSFEERSGSLASGTAINYEVWANANAPADLASRLSANGVSVLNTQTIPQYLGDLSRSAPTLSLWFYLFAGGLALVLAIGVILLGAYVGAASRIYEYAALRVAGVRPGVLRTAVLREYGSILAISLVVGVAAGFGGAVLMLPSIALVTVGQAVGAVPYGGRMFALYAALAASVVAMTIVMLLAMRLLRRGTPDRLREGVR